jgi:hypothetical protein
MLTNGCSLLLRQCEQPVRMSAEGVLQWHVGHGLALRSGCTTAMRMTATMSLPGQVVAGSRPHAGTCLVCTIKHWPLQEILRVGCADASYSLRLMLIDASLSDTGIEPAVHGTVAVVWLRLGVRQCPEPGR